MTDFVRVKSKSTGHEHTTSRAHAKNTKDLDIIPNKAAVNLNGDPLPPKYRTTLTATDPGDGSPDAAKETK